LRKLFKEITYQSKVFLNNPIINNPSDAFTFTNSQYKAADLMINRLNPNQWIYLEMHHSFSGMFYSHERIERWENLTEAKNCTFLQTVVLRNPLSRIVSNLGYNNVEVNIFPEFIKNRENWLIRYILFGTCDENLCGYNRAKAFTMTLRLDEPVHLPFLKNYMKNFDLIGFVDDIPTFIDNLKKLLNWDFELHDVLVRKQPLKDAFSEKLLKEFMRLNQLDFSFHYHYKNITSFYR
jgi:hypothetical protein